MALNLDYTQLLFAAEVRKLAVEMWNAERDGYVKSTMQIRTPDQIAAWDQANPFSKYIPLALGQILKVAVHIKETEDLPSDSSGS